MSDLRRISHGSEIINENRQRGILVNPLKPGSGHRVYRRLDPCCLTPHFVLKELVMVADRTLHPLPRLTLEICLDSAEKEMQSTYPFRDFQTSIMASTSKLYFQTIGRRK
jgi:hypothetical protein